MKLLLGDCLEVLKPLPENSVDAVVTDPPYGLSFMGKKWDYDVPSVEIWKECLRVLKPGGHLLSFAGTRTHHRICSAIEDAGFEIRDMIAWVYGSGFPKSLNIGKAVDKLQGNKRKSLGITKGVGNNNTESMNSGVSKSSEFNHEYELTKGTSEWEGWGTALKPALEPITVARKPLSEKSVAENCLKWGTGGINIDESRVGTDKIMIKGGGGGEGTGWGKKEEINEERIGRFPANLLHDNSEEVRECFPETKSGKIKPYTEKPISPSSFNFVGRKKPAFDYADNGNASRFFKSIIYTPKASKSERNKGCEELPNNHPTVKPIALMEYLINMITPKGGVVLDPFMGSGSTGVACKNLKREFIGIEKEAEYLKIAEARINGTPDKLL